MKKNSLFNSLLTTEEENSGFNIKSNNFKNATESKNNGGNAMNDVIDTFDDDCDDDGDKKESELYNDEGNIE
jgi:hypothetical protein